MYTLILVFGWASGYGPALTSQSVTGFTSKDKCEIVAKSVTKEFDNKGVFGGSQ